MIPVYHYLVSYFYFYNPHLPRVASHPVQEFPRTVLLAHGFSVVNQSCILLFIGVAS